jgi:hypothetical protein
MFAFLGPHSDKGVEDGSVGSLYGDGDEMAAE